MDSRTQERVEQWDSRPFSGGYDGLTDLSETEFSGAVSAGSAWLFMLNGRIVGVVDGAIEDFENASGTIYEAPHPSLPLLSAMEEQGGDTRAKYYTNETPLREVDGTLQDGSFTGYIELSENVLSGDYYAVYYGGRRMAAAYIGSAERLVTGDEAFERADDEVGIYEVIDVDVDVTDVPGTETDTASGSDSSASASASGTGGATATDDDRAETDATPSADPTESAVEPIDVSSAEPSVTIEDDPTDVGDGVTAESALESGTDAGSDEPSGITTEYDETDGASAATGTGTRAGITDASDAPAAVDPDPDPEPSPSDAESPATERPTVADDEPVAAEPVPDAEAVTEAEAEPDTDAQTDTDPTASPDPAEVEAAAEQLDQNDISWTGDDASDPEPDVSPGPETTGTRDAAEQVSTTSVTAAGTATDAAPSTAADADADDSELEERFEEEEQWRETRRIPSIDPDDSESDGSMQSQSAAGSASGSGAGSTAERRSGDARDAAATGTGRAADAHASSADTAGTRDQRASSSTRGSQANADAGRAAATSTSSAEHDQRVQQLSDRIERLEEQRESLEAKNKELAAEREQLREKNRELSETVDRLESRIEELETELQQARQGADGAAASAGTQLSAERALAGTNLFVRYRSKSQPTLELAHEGDADREEVATNLQLEHHTEFDADDVAVDGTPYEEFLTGTMAYRFVDWLTEMALYEIRDTGHASGLADLYDAIPQIDRAELNATISLEDDDTEDVPDQVTFDVVAFDKMGNPLVLVALNDSRQPVTEDTLTELEASASAVKANYPDLAAAMAVTSSYFEPGALEVTEQATSGGLLSRGSKLSYVNLSRKQGYHLCLVESRSEGFHMNVPEL